MTDTVDRTQSSSGGSGLDGYFKLSERGTSAGTEIRAGFTTFLVMAYIIFVNPNIISADLGFGDASAVAAATALVAGLLCILMGVVANVPIAMATGLGINGVVAFSLVLGQGLTPAGAMGVIVIEGLVVLALVVVGLREAIMHAVPMALKRAIGVGIGLFIMFIGFVDGGLIRQPVGDGPVPVEFVFPNSKAAVVTLVGLLITVILYVLKVRGALVISILVTAALSLIIGFTSVPDQLALAPDFSTLGDFDLSNVFNQLGLVAALLTIFSLMLTDFFDTMGTATAIAEQAELIDDDGNIPGVGKLLFVDSLGAAAGGAAGVSSNTSYIESAAGVAEGGRSGLTAVVVGVLFLVAIFLTPLANLIPLQATAPVLILIGFLMAGLIKGIDFDDIEEGFPALLTIVLMPFTFSITVGIGAGFVMYVLIKTIKGKFGDVHPLMWVVAIAFVIYFAQAALNTAISA
ncbi:MAG TPA: NCS2 family permease [Acidimicrobiia bacterium]|nr:NCS2 family permease [Acidimicrobiia bacterium]